MRVLVEIGHPAHVHHFKNMIWELEKSGCEIKIAARKKDIAVDLLEAYNFDYEIFGKNYSSIYGKAYGLVKNDISMYGIVRKFKPDIFVSRASPHSAHVSRLINKPHIAFCDTEHSTLNDMLAYPFTDVICTPSCYQKKVDPKKHIIFNGYKELAYLHPNYFIPDPSVLDEIGLRNNEKYVVLRLVSWKASHDLGDKGFTDLEQIVHTLEPYVRVLITSESNLPIKLEKYKINLSPEKVHHLLYFADIYIGESATMATESAVLGVPAIFVSTSKRGYTEELERKYDLMYTYSDPTNAQKNALEKALDLIKDEKTKKNWQNKKENLLHEKIDVTKFMTDIILNYRNKSV